MFTLSNMTHTKCLNFTEIALHPNLFERVHIECDSESLNSCMELRAADNNQCSIKFCLDGYNCLNNTCIYVQAGLGAIAVAEI